MIQFILRNLTEPDEKFIYNSFLQTLKESYPFIYIPKSLYYNSQSEIIKFLLESQQVLIACYPEDPEEIIGYVIYNYLSDTFILHYIYIKKMYRNKDYASNIINQIINNYKTIIVTNICDHYNTLKYKLPAKTVYDPYLIGRLRKLV